MRNRILIAMACVGVVLVGIMLWGGSVYADCGDVETTIIDCPPGEDPICHVLNLIVEIMTIGVGILGVIGIIISGIQYLTGGGNEEKIRKAKRRLFELVIGVALYVALTSVVAWLNPGGLFCGGNNNGSGSGENSAENIVAGFNDVKEGAYYADAVKWAKDSGIMNGLSNTEFGVGKTIKRQDAATILWRAAGEPSSNGKKAEDCYGGDVSGEKKYYTDALAWMCSTGYMQGYGGQRFGLNDNITRLQFVTILWRTAGSPTGSPNSGFTDVPSGSEKAVNWAVANGIVSKDTKFNPSGLISREQAATMLYRRYK